MLKIPIQILSSQLNNIKEPITIVNLCNSLTFNIPLAIFITTSTKKEGRCISYVYLIDLLLLRVIIKYYDPERITSLNVHEGLMTMTRGELGFINHYKISIDRFILSMDCNNNEPFLHKLKEPIELNTLTYTQLISILLIKLSIYTQLKEVSTYFRYTVESYFNTNNKMISKLSNEIKDLLLTHSEVCIKRSKEVND